MSWLDNIFGTYHLSGGKGTPTEEYTQGGLLGRGGVLPRLKEKLGELAGEYFPKKQLISPVSDYGQFPTATPTPELTPTPTQVLPTPIPETGYEAVPLTEQQPFAFPAGDKPPIPPQYHEALVDVPYANIIASVLAQETGGYDYMVPDPETGEIVDWDTAREKKIVGKDGEVGIGQIIPKWYWKEAGFPDEESYAEALYDPHFSISEVDRILNGRFKLFGDWKKALNAYNKNPSYPDEILGRIGVQT